MSQAISSDDLTNYAEILLWAVRHNRKTPLKNKDIIIIKYDSAAERLAEILYAQLIDAHLHPVLEAVLTTNMKAELYINSSYGQLTYEIPGKLQLYEEAKGVIRIHAPVDMGALSRVNPLTINENRKSSLKLDNLINKRKQAGALGWTECIFPTEDLAASSGLSFERYKELFIRACYLNMPYPAKEWIKISRQTSETAAELTSLDISRIHVESEYCDFTFSPGKNRKWLGTLGDNIPGCEVYISPDYRTMQGKYLADLPSINMDRTIYGIQLEFNQGVVVRAKAMGGEKFLLDQLRMDSGARRIGEFSLTDKRISRISHYMASTLLDENFGGEFGNCHIALGQSLLKSFSGPQETLTPELKDYLGFNSSGIHWDLVNTENKTVTATLADGRKKIIYEGGSFAF
ncbi:aminopeptidase [Maridesulfovibrio bastinii]|uniref:aminopeptidase n=1 Tax=Maridesulfovibrio bastinii TaxID=47157 RepID=UPI000420C4BF|nr:aminopeptidase [Maridesulfovibrio bastinii]